MSRAPGLLSSPDGAFLVFMFSNRFLAPSCTRKTQSFIYSRVIHSSRRHSPDLTVTDAQRKTIFALSTPPGKGGVAIVRISGPDSLLVWNTMIRSPKTEKKLAEPVPWKLQRCQIVHPENKSLIDDGLAVYFKGAQSSTEK